MKPICALLSSIVLITATTSSMASASEFKPENFIGTYQITTPECIQAILKNPYRTLADDEKPFSPIVRVLPSYDTQHAPEHMYALDVSGPLTEIFYLDAGRKDAAYENGVGVSNTTDVVRNGYLQRSAFEAGLFLGFIPGVDGFKSSLQVLRDGNLQITTKINWKQKVTCKLVRTGDQRLSGIAKDIVQKHDVDPRDFAEYTKQISEDTSTTEYVRQDALLALQIVNSAKQK